MPELLKVILLSIAPISELRGGIPYAIEQAEYHPLLAFAICVSVNILAFPITIFFLEFLHPIFSKVKFYEKMYNFFVIRTRNKIEKDINKWGFWGLMIFVMIPFPATGAYSGSFAAWLFGIDKRKGFLSVSFGVIAAGIIVTVSWLFFRETLSFLFKQM